MKHLNISDDAMKIILENAAWSDFGLKVNKTQDQKIDESTEEVEEEAHVCPLCSSHLDEAISDEALMEHTANVLEAVNAATLNEEEEEEDGEELFEEDESEDESEDEDDEEDFDDEDEQIEEGKMPAQLKKAMKGKMGKKGMMPKGMKYK
jgi:DNA repair exonuclease SbcCD ATPase subunit